MFISLSEKDIETLLIIENKFKESNMTIVNFTNEEYQRYRKIIKILCQQEVLRDLKMNNANAYRCIGNFDIFHDLLKEQEKTVKELSMSEFEKKLADLLARAKKFDALNRMKLDEDSKINTKLVNVWMDDVQIFYKRYLKNHALSQRIDTLLFQRNYSQLVAALTSISRDTDFIDKMNGVDKVEVPKYQAKTLPEYDVFISHANQDKEELIEELYHSLDMLGIKIFYDKESLEWGDNWKERILNGVKKAEFAIIVISENFFDREWTEKELSEFLNLQNQNGQKLILPIVHNISMKQLQEKYPNVADIQAIDSSKYNCDQIALLFARQLIKRLKAN